MSAPTAITDTLGHLQQTFTGERVVPGSTPENIFRESQMRYLFASQFVKGRSVLDIASGTGIGSHCLLKAGAANCLGLDIDLAALRYASSQYAGCHFAGCDAMNLCLADESVDLVVSFETIEHVLSPETFLSECRRVLRKKGLLICSTPNRSVFQWYPKNPFHVAEMNPDEFVRLVKKYFPNCSVYGQVNVNYPFYVAESLFRRRLVPLLDKVRIKNFIKRHFSSPPMKICPERDFSLRLGSAPEFEVGPLTTSLLKRSIYVLVAAEK
jgi:ubiquinone/menaquinone biosynthesis C-methylase UbiE